MIFTIARNGGGRTVAPAVGGYITAAYFFTSSTSFANPAVTAARTLPDTFAGIRPLDAPAFVVAQLIGVATAVVIARALHPGVSDVADGIVMPHPQPAGR